MIKGLTSKKKSALVVCDIKEINFFMIPLFFVYWSDNLFI